MKILLALLLLTAPAHANLITVEYTGTVSAGTFGTYATGSNPIIHHPYSDLNGQPFVATFTFDDATFKNASLAIEGLSTLIISWGTGTLYEHGASVMQNPYVYMRVGVPDPQFQFGPCPGAPCGRLIVAVPMRGFIPSLIDVLRGR